MKVSSVREWVPVGDRTDRVGRIIVRVILIERGKNKNMKGNLTRTFTVNDATVSEVAELTRQACLDEGQVIPAAPLSDLHGWGITH